MEKTLSSSVHQTPPYCFPHSPKKIVYTYMSCGSWWFVLMACILGIYADTLTPSFIAKFAYGLLVLLTS